MNIILFENHELEKPLPRHDARTVHLLKVLHKQEGDSFDAGMLGANRGTGRIEKINSDGSLAFSLELSEPPPKRIPIHIAVGFPRPIQLRRLLRDLANLGVEAIDLLGTDLGEKSYRDTKLLIDGGAQAALMEGAIQARDTCIPALSVYTSLDVWLFEFFYIVALFIVQKIGIETSNHVEKLNLLIVLKYLFINPTGTYWYLHTLILCNILYYISRYIFKESFINSILIFSLLLYTISCFISLYVGNYVYYIKGRLLWRIVIARNVNLSSPL
jgi:RsmE family RNA methyltransferase